MMPLQRPTDGTAVADAGQRPGRGVGQWSASEGAGQERNPWGGGGALARRGEARPCLMPGEGIARACVRGTGGDWGRNRLVGIGEGNWHAVRCELKALPGGERRHARPRCQ
jgi:hypothetical protein